MRKKVVLGINASMIALIETKMRNDTTTAKEVWGDKRTGLFPYFSIFFCWFLTVEATSSWIAPPYSISLVEEEPAHKCDGKGATISSGVF